MRWERELNRNRFAVLSYPEVHVSCLKIFAFRKLTNLPQECCELYILVKSPDRSERSVQDFDCKIHLTSNTRKHRLSAVLIISIITRNQSTRDKKNPSDLKRSISSHFLSIVQHIRQRVVL